jgi:hypothetical protein
MAAALLFTRPGDPADEWLTWARTADPAAAAAALAAQCAGRHPEYWDRRLTFGGRPQPRPVALLGSERVDLLLNNVVLPFWAARGGDRLAAAFLDQGLPLEPRHAVARQTAHALFGPDHPESWYRDGLRQQGLVQIFHDFCLDDRSRCAACPLPADLPDFAQQNQDIRTPTYSRRQRTRKIFSKKT